MTKIDLPEPDEVMVAWGGNQKVVIVSGVTTAAKAAEAMHIIADAFKDSAEDAL